MSISNDGIPLPSDTKEKIFIRGFSSKLDGTGLGLAIVRKLVEAHGWKIALEKSDDLGTTFRITI